MQMQSASNTNTNTNNNNNNNNNTNTNTNNNDNDNDNDNDNNKPKIETIDNSSSCKVCDNNRELCVFPSTSVMMFPGEGEVSCTDIINRQSINDIIMGHSVCTALKKRFRHSCLQEKKPKI